MTAVLEAQAVTRLDQLTDGRGVAVLIGEQPVALFLVRGRLYAVDNIDPISGRSVLSRGITGDVDGAVTVASPLYKHRFDLVTGRCLDADAHIDVHEVRCTDGVVFVRLGPRR